ncbi:MAG: tol-pal system protein YbgF [bacterium]|nr:tol-pal system protein YbgF [bacterium]
MRIRSTRSVAGNNVLRVAVVVTLLGSTFGCATIAELRKVEARLIDIERGRPSGGGALREQVADYVADIDSLREEMRTLEGRLEVAEKAAADALEDARRARLDLAQIKAAAQRGGAPAAAGDAGGDGASTPAAAGATIAATGGGQPADEDLSAEIQAYRSAHAAWQKEDTGMCVDRFRDFLQTYPASPYADDAAFWMADCHYKQAEYKKAVLRFDEVVRNYPAGNKASDALYRQGESLLKLGPGFREAAKRAFERVIKEYPDSARASEARRQLDLYTAG